MTRRSLGVLAIILIALIVLVATAGLDNLPRDVRQSASAAATRLISDRTTFDQDRQYIQQAIHDDPALFRARSTSWNERIQRDTAQLASAAASAAALDQLVKANRRTDTDKAKHAIADLDNARTAPLRDTSEIRREVDRWLGYKRELPRRLETMRSAYDAIIGFDLDSAAAPTAKAMGDWPDKRSDLQNRIDALKSLKEHGTRTWESSASLRTAAESNDRANLDYAALFSSADDLDATARQLKDGAASLNALASQLYVSWDKVLVDLENDGRAKIRTVSTRYPDATLSRGETSSTEQSQTLEAGRARDAERRVGMVIERKPAGKYDSEAERVVQPPAYAYIAPPGQSNHYGSWTNGVWHWLPQYLILSQLLNAHRTPVTSGDFYAYDQARRNGQIFYGRNNEFRQRWTPPTGAPRYPSGLRGVFSRARDWAQSHGDSGFTKPPASSSPSSGGWWKERQTPSWGERGYSGSKYQSRGGYSGSRYQSGGTFSSKPSFGSRQYSRGFGSAARSFSRGGRR